jgi:hypothetical protein
MPAGAVGGHAGSHRDQKASDGVEAVEHRPGAPFFLRPEHAPAAETLKFSLDGRE